MHLIRLTEASRTYGVHQQTLRRWINSGLIHGYRAGPKLIMVDSDELAQKMAEPIRTGD